MEFFQIQTERQPIKTKLGIIGNKFALPKADWDKLKLKQANQYYQANRAQSVDGKTVVEAGYKRAPKFKIPDVS